MPPISISDNTKGTRNIYIISCSDDERYSYVERSMKGVDLEGGVARLIKTQRIERVATLMEGSEPFVMSIQTDTMPHPAQLRVTHRNPQ